MCVCVHIYIYVCMYVCVGIIRYPQISSVNSPNWWID